MAVDRPCVELLPPTRAEEVEVKHQGFLHASIFLSGRKYPAAIAAYEAHATLADVRNALCVAAPNAPPPRDVLFVDRKGTLIDGADEDHVLAASLVPSITLRWRTCLPGSPWGGEEDAKRHQTYDWFSVMARYDDFRPHLLPWVCCFKQILCSEVKDVSIIEDGGFHTIVKGELGSMTVICKRVKTTDIHSRDACDFCREVELLSKLDHPNIVRLLGACTIPQHLSTTLEFASDGSLHDSIHNTPHKLSLVQVLRIAAGVARGLLYLHSQSPIVVHGDVKPTNVLIDSTGLPKLTDFGTSRKWARSITSCLVPPYSHSPLLPLDTICSDSDDSFRGTPEYTAPEVLMGACHIPSSDVFSFGILLWEVATGCVPYEDMDTMEVIQAMLLDPDVRPPLHAAVSEPSTTPTKHPSTIPSVWAPLAHLIRSCWETDIHKRPLMKDVVRALEEMQRFLHTPSA